LRPPGRAKTYIYGQQYGAAGFTARHPRNREYVDRELAELSDGESHILSIAPFGAEIATAVSILYSLRNSHRTTSSMDGVTGSEIAFNANGGVRPGLMLHSHIGAGTSSRNEIQSIVFTNVPASQVLAFRKIDDATLSATFTAVDTNTTLKARLEAIYGGTITVSGTLSTSTDAVTGETLYSGTLNALFAGSLASTDVPLLMVVTGEVESLVISGATGTGTYRGATITPGNTEGTVQTAVRATGGNNANVVIKGTSNAVSAGANLVDTEGGAEFSSGEHDGHEDTDLLFDGSTGNASSASYDEDGEAGWDFGDGNPQAISKVRLYFGENNAAQTALPTNYVIEVQEQGSLVWTEYSSYNGVALPQGWKEHTATATNIRKVRVVFGDAVTIINEIEIIGAPITGNGRYNAYFPITVGDIAIGVAAGTGYSVSGAENGSSFASNLASTTIRNGGTLTDVVLVTATGNGDAVDFSIARAYGWTAHLHVISALGTTPTLDVVIEHSDDGSTGWSTLGTFAQVTAASSQRLVSASNTTAVKRYVRAKRTVAGTGAEFIYAVSFAPYC
jgi:hypothetical protein